MPIEDVDYLLENSEPESSMVFIDSSSRDRSIFPSPSEYVVTFDEPFKNVFGIDILDATVPGTMYNVDVINNRLVVIMFAGEDCTALTGAESADTLAVSTDFYALGFHPDAVALLSATTTSTASVSAVVLEGPVFDAYPPVAAGAGEQASVRAFVRRTIRGVPLYVGGRGGGSFTFAHTAYAMVDAVSTPLNVGLAAWLADGPPPFALVASTAPWTASVYAGASASASMFDIVYFESAPLTPTQVDAYRGGGGMLLYDFAVAYVDLAVGNYTISTLQQLLQSALAAACGHDFSVASTSASSIDVQGKYLFKATERFVLCIPYCTSGQLLGFDTYADASTRSEPASSRPYNALAFGQEPVPMFMSVSRSDGSHRVEAPGLVNLLGVRYITLRCPEIEQNMSSVGKYNTFSTGIGVFKLSNPNELAQLRFDYVSLIRKPFYPIGKLFRVTFRFQLSNGTLYDFKGINHQLLVTIKYYTPTKKGKFVSSVLNPDYDPDYLRYVVRQTRDAARIYDRGFEEPGPEEPGPGEEEESEQGVDEATKRRILLEQYKNDFLQDHDLEDFHPTR